jgi:hypothetical protein
MSVKSLGKSAGRVAWRMLAPIRAPFRRRLYQFVQRSVQEHPARVETVLLLHHVISEIARLEEQMEALREAVQELTAAQRGAGVVSGPRTVPLGEAQGTHRDRIAV